MNLQDEQLLGQAISLAAAARAAGSRPFGALLADQDGNVVMTALNTTVTEHDSTAHAEMNLLRAANRQIDALLLHTCSLYTSTEPCVMCTGAIYWAGIRRVVFALSAVELSHLQGSDPYSDLLLSSKVIFAAGARPTIVEGPALTEQALAVHQGFWAKN
jgi:tRNA(Arg) A34 adenosine deaminase TadA